MTRGRGSIAEVVGSDLRTRTEDEILSRALLVTIGGKLTEIPVLTIKQARAWRTYFETSMGALGEADVSAAPAKLASLGSVGSDLIVDLLVAYDEATGTRDGVLGGRDSLEEVASDREVYAALREALSASYPFAEDVIRVLGTVRDLIGSAALLGASSPPEESRSGSSDSGASSPTTMRSDSPTS